VSVTPSFFAPIFFSESETPLIRESDTLIRESANNAKGRFEMACFKALGFTLVYKGKDIEGGVELYETGCCILRPLVA
jgi:hypothetical protein